MVLAASTGDIVVLLITGLLGGVIGATFTRITSRNDLRRDRYSEALSALRAFADVEAQQRAASPEAKKVYDLRDWMLIDAEAVGTAYATLVDKTNTETKANEVEQARLNFIEAARAYSRWTLHKRAFLHVKAPESRQSLGDS
jgi:hypothetical protein